MKRTLLISLLLLCLAGLNADLVDRIVAKVGNEIILMSDIQNEMLHLKAAGILDESMTPAIVLQQIIQNKVIVQKAKEMDIRLDEGKVRREAERRVTEIKKNYPSEAEFRVALAQEKLTEPELLSSIKDMLTERALSEQLIARNVTSKVNVTEAEMEAFYEASKDTLAVKPVTWKTGVIMREIKPSEATDNAKLAEIRDIQERLDKGGDFAALATQYSDCPSKERGGDLGFFSKGMMVKPFEDAAFNLNRGEISPIVKTEYGYHLIKLTETRGNEIRASHILKIVAPSHADTLAAREQMEEVRAKFLNKEASFEDLARQYSNDPDAAENGGVLGDFAANEFPELFAGQINSSPVGGITPVLENQGILYLFSRLEELPARIFEYEEVKDKLQDYLRSTKTLQAYNVWIQELMKEAYVQIIE